MILIYLDPGSGSFLIQLVVAALAGITIAVGTQWRKIKRFFNKNKVQNSESDDGEEDEDN